MFSGSDYLASTWCCILSGQTLVRTALDLPEIVSLFSAVGDGNQRDGNGFHVISHLAPPLSTLAPHCPIVFCTCPTLGDGLTYGLTMCPT